MLTYADVDEDLQLLAPLAATPLSRDARTAVAFRAGKKRVLAAAILALRARLHELS